MIAIEFKFPDWENKLKAAKDELYVFVAAIMQTNRGMLFDAEGAYNGHEKWAPLKLRVGQILKLTGTLSQSMGPMGAKGKPGPSGIVRFNGDEVTIGTTLAYARLMNDGTVKMPGGKLVAKNAKALKIPLPKGLAQTEASKELRGKKTDQQIAKIREKMRRMRSQNSIDKATFKIKQLEARKANGQGGSDFIFRKSVKIPARPFDQWNDQDQAELEASLVNKIAEILNR